MTTRSATSALPSTATEAMARARLLLRFPLVAERMDEWRATIQSLIGFTEAGEPQQTGPSQLQHAVAVASAGGRNGRAVTSVRSPPPPPAQRRLWHVPRADELDETSMASSGPCVR